MAARVIPQDRLSTVVDTASQVFIRRGYRATQMQDVADELGLAKGTLYLYAGGKEALFAAALRYADGAETVPDTSSLPLPAPVPGELAELVAGRLAAELPDLALTRALERTARPDTPAEAAAELSGVVVDLYKRLARHRVAIKLVDRCAAELPELGSVWRDSGRGAQMSAMEAYLRDREGAGLLAVPGSLPVAARTAVELCVLWAVHLPWDTAPTEFRSAPADGDVARVLSALFASGLVADR